MELMDIQHRILLIQLMDIQHWQTAWLGQDLFKSWLLHAVGWQRVKVVTRTTIKMASGVQDITCVFVEVAGSCEKNFNLTVSWDGV